MDKHEMLDMLLRERNVKLFVDEVMATLNKFEMDEIIINSESIDQVYRWRDTLFKYWNNPETFEADGHDRATAVRKLSCLLLITDTAETIWPYYHLTKE